MLELRFREEDHTYWVVGLVPSVTTIISSQGAGVDYSGIPAFVLKRAGEIGTATHKVIEDFYKNDGVIASSDPSVEKYLDSFVGFLNNPVIKLPSGELEPCEFEVLESEMQLWNHKEWFAGTVDFVAKVNGTQAIVDIKTTNTLHLDTVGIQLSAYRFLVVKETKYKPKERYALHLVKGQQGYLVECARNEDEGEFLQMAREYNAKAG